MASATISQERANFCRAIQANELSVNVLWNFLKIAVPVSEKDRLSSQWWISVLPKNKKGDLNLLKFQRDAIQNKQPQDWDMSVLASAIEKLPNSKSFINREQKLVVERLHISRNKLCHTFPALYSKEDFEQLFDELEDCYKNLLGDQAEELFQRLKDIRTQPILEKDTEVVLARRDESLFNADRNEMLEIHQVLQNDLDQIFKIAEEMKMKAAKIQEHVAYIAGLTDSLFNDADKIQDTISAGGTKIQEIKSKPEDGASDLLVPVQMKAGDVCSAETALHGPEKSRPQIPQKSTDKDPVSILKEYCDKEKIVQRYNFEESVKPQRGFQYAVTIQITSSGVTEEKSFKGEMQATKKDAKKVAAQKAIEELGIS